jgi:hypothetical protein
MREYTRFAMGDDRRSLSILADDQTPPDEYRKALNALGRSLGQSLLDQLGTNLPSRICIVCTVEDADSLAAGMISTLEERGLDERVRVVCFWNDRIELNGISLAPILKEYREPCKIEDSALVVVKSIISSACVVRTNLANLIANATPRRIFVVAPVMFKGADRALGLDFESAISGRFEFITQAIDDERRDGKWVVPGVGGDIYTRLGYGGASKKNVHVPLLVKARRQHPALVA